MVKHDGIAFKYYNEKGKHELLSQIPFDKAADILWDLGLSSDFRCDQSISGALYIAVRKLQGFSDEDIQKLTR